ncbi:defender against death DAD protein [Dipodascopsis tothii]|uniref:defender against death DAD protein n=1 Tax=Dipodascopsis tothii TaxID=44089 RepID=UPI0034CD8203
MPAKKVAKIPSAARARADAAPSASFASAISQVWSSYVTTTPKRVKLIDSFLGFLLVTGVLQFAFCLLVGNYPFNAFLSGFAATVGQFVLTASLRIQANPENASQFKTVSPERAFADFVFGSLILHFFVYNFIN